MRIRFSGEGMVTVRPPISTISTVSLLGWLAADALADDAGTAAEELDAESGCWLHAESMSEAASANRNRGLDRLRFMVCFNLLYVLICLFAQLAEGSHLRPLAP